MLLLEQFQALKITAAGYYLDVPADQIFYICWRDGFGMMNDLLTDNLVVWSKANFFGTLRCDSQPGGGKINFSTCDHRQNISKAICDLDG